MKTENSPVQYRISIGAACVIVAIVATLEGLQVLFDLLVFTAPLSYLITFFALPSLWLTLRLFFGVEFFSGSKAPIKIASIIGAAAIEMIPFVNALPAITLGAIGAIVASRMEDRVKHFAAQRKLAEHHSASGKRPIPLKKAT